MSNYRIDFPIFKNRPALVYLDSAATTQKPEMVIEAVRSFYTQNNATIHRGLYDLSIKSTELYEDTRQIIATFIAASSPREIIFTRNATEGLNLLAHSLKSHVSKGGEIILSHLEHHANLVPWQLLAQEVGMQIRFINLTDSGEIDLEHFKTLITTKTQIVSLSHCSNVLGTITPLPSIKKILRQQGSQAFLIADLCQSTPHLPIAIQDLGCDFAVFSGHKLYAPSGTGVLWGRIELLESLPPYQTGGDMISTVSLESATWNDVPWKFEAGTPNIEGIIGLGAAITYIQEIGMENIQKHTSTLHSFAKSELEKIPELKILGNPQPESGIISFTIGGLHPHDVAELLAQKDICIRAGNHCAEPLHKLLGITASNRISIGIYTTKTDIELFLSALRELIANFRNV